MSVWNHFFPPFCVTWERSWGRGLSDIHNNHWAFTFTHLLTLHGWVEPDVMHAMADARACMQCVIWGHIRQLLCLQIIEILTTVNHEVVFCVPVQSMLSYSDCNQWTPRTSLCSIHLWSRRGLRLFGDNSCDGTGWRGDFQRPISFRRVQAHSDASWRYNGEAAAFRVDY